MTGPERTDSLPRIQPGVRVERWFGRSRCLAVDPDRGDGFLVARTLPGETVTVERVVDGRRRSAFATAVETSSPERIDPYCPHYDRCSGCDLLHVSARAELEYRRTVVAETLSRHAGVAVAPEDVEDIGDAARGGHRVRSRLEVSHEGGRSIVGLRDLPGQLSHVPDCPANADRVRHALVSLSTEPLGDGVAAIEVVAGVEGLAVVLEYREAEARGRVCEAALRSAAEFAAVGVRAARGPVELVAGAWPRQLPVGEVALAVGVDAWTQPTPERAAEVHRWVASRGAHVGRRLLDGTSGTGALAFLLSAEAREVLCVDPNPAALASAQAGATALGLSNIAFRGGKLETIAPRLVRAKERFGSVVINPMRRSLGATCMEAVAGLEPADVVYLAPAPRSGAEDVGLLVAAGYRLSAVAAAGLHPGTGAVMACVHLIRER